MREGVNPFSETLWQSDVDRYPLRRALESAVSAGLCQQQCYVAVKSQAECDLIQLSLDAGFGANIAGAEPEKLTKKMLTRTLLHTCTWNIHINFSPSFLPPSFPLSGGNSRYTLSEIIKSWWWSSREWDWHPYKGGPRELSCSFCNVKVV